MEIFRWLVPSNYVQVFVSFVITKKLELQLKSFKKIDFWWSIRAGVCNPRHVPIMARDVISYGTGRHFKTVVLKLWYVSKFADIYQLKLLI